MAKSPQSERLLDVPTVTVPKVPRKAAPIVYRPLSWERFRGRNCTLMACEGCENVWEDIDAALETENGYCRACPGCGSLKTGPRYYCKDL